MRAITEPIKQLSAAAMEADLKSWLPIFQERGSIEIVALARALNGRVLEFARPHAGLGRLGSVFVANAIERIFFPNAMAWPAVTIHLPRSISPVRIRLASLTGSPVGLRIWNCVPIGEDPLKLGALPYHTAVVRHLQSGEAAHWAWFESERMSTSYTEKVRLELLKSTYRLTRVDQPRLYESAGIALEKLCVDLPVTIYQRQGGADSPNAALIFLPDEAAIMLMGNIGELLNEAEMLALLGHEIAHHRLYTMDGGQYFTAARLLGWCVEQPGCDAAFAETDRLFQLHTEIFADMGALHVTGDRDAVIASLIKVMTGLKSVSPSAYLEQTEEILEKDKQGSEELSHPELFIRAKALDMLAADPPGIGQTELLVRGPIDAKRLDILGQQALSALSRKLVERLLTPAFMRNEYTLNLAERYFPGYGEGNAESIGGEEAGSKSAASALKSEIAATAESCHDYFAYLLLDFATVDPESGDAQLAWSLDLANQAGIFSVYEPVARKELKRKKDELTRLKRSATEIIKKVNDAA